MSGHHDSHLAHHFDTREQQFESGKLGMWLFLATEILLFGGLFCAYAVYRASHPEIFIYAHRFLDKRLGGINTAILIGSSFTMAWAVRAAQLGRQRALKVLLAVTIACAFGFLGIKYVEYQHKWKEGLLWGKRYAPHAEHQARPADEPAKTVAPTPSPGVSGEEHTLLPPPGAPPAGLAVSDHADEQVHLAQEAPKNVQVFFSIYFAMTGLHGVHVLAGIALLSWILLRASRGEFGPDYFIPVDLVGLYWHVVDLIWIFLFPLLYLIH